MQEENLQAFHEESNTSRGRAITAGAVNVLKRWPGPERADLFDAILAGCLAFAVLGILVLVPAARFDDMCRSSREKLKNIYFIKHENRTWTNEELCYIETAARRYPDYNIFMFNLLTKQDLNNETVLNKKFIDTLLDYYLLLKEKNNIIYQNANSSEINMRRRLSEISNILNIDVSIENFFAGSIISKRIDNLSSNEIELAAKFQIIWDLPGITVEPNITYHLENFKNIFDKAENDSSVIVQMDEDLQGTSVPCQSFIGFVIDRIAKSSFFTDRSTILNDALMDFCPSITNCTGVRIIKPSSESPPNFTTCPTIYSAANVSNNFFNGVTITSNNQ